MVDTYKTLKNFSKILVSSAPPMSQSLKEYDFSDKNDGFPASLFICNYCNIPLKRAL